LIQLRDDRQVRGAVIEHDDAGIILGRQMILGSTHP